MEIGKELLYLSRADVEKADISIKEYIDVLAESFKIKTQGSIDMPNKTGIVPRSEGWFHAMPCYVGGSVDASGMKWISMNKLNPGRGHMALNGLIIISDSETCLPVAVLDCIHITGMRTGAVSGLAFRLLARGDETVAGIIGCGLQGRTNLEALLCECPKIETIYAWGPRKETVLRYCADIKASLGREVTPLETQEELVRRSQILAITAPGYPLSYRSIQADWIQKGTTITTVNQDHQFVEGEVNKFVDRIYVDDIPTFNNSKTTEGAFIGITKRPIELGEVLLDIKLGRESPDEIILSAPIGIGMDDVVTGKLIVNRALKMGIGTLLPL